MLYSALGSFFFPSCIMVFVYIRIYYAAKKRARRGINKKSRNKLDPVSEEEAPCLSFQLLISLSLSSPAVQPLHVNQLLSDAISA